MHKGEPLDTEQDVSFNEAKQEVAGMAQKPLYVYPLLAAAVSQDNNSGSMARSLKVSAIDMSVRISFTRNFALQIVAVSSAAVAFSSMSEISPCLLAYWRTQFTAIILLPAGVYSIWRMTAGETFSSLLDCTEASTNEGFTEKKPHSCIDI